MDIRERLKQIRDRIPGKTFTIDDFSRQLQRSGIVHASITIEEMQDPKQHPLENGSRVVVCAGGRRVGFQEEWMPKFGTLSGMEQRGTQQDERIIDAIVDVGDVLSAHGVAVRVEGKPFDLFKHAVQRSRRPENVIVFRKTRK